MAQTSATTITLKRARFERDVAGGIDDLQEFFYQLKGDMCLKVIENNKFKDVPIKEGEAFVLPGQTSHSPQVRIHS